MRIKILSLKDFVINVNKNYAFKKNCGVTIFINARQRGQLFWRKLFASNSNFIPTHFKTMILFIPAFPLDNLNFLFYLTIQANLILSTHIVNYTTTKILVSNNFNCPLGILWYQKLGYIVDIDYNDCFLTDTQTTFDSAIFPSRAQLFFDLHARVALVLTDILMETQLDNSVRVYRDKVAVREISELVAQYPFIWKSKGFVQISLERWIKVYLNPGWKSKISIIKPRVYLLGNDFCRVLNETFNKMHC